MPANGFFLGGGWRKITRNHLQYQSCVLDLGNFMTRFLRFVSSRDGPVFRWNGAAGGRTYSARSREEGRGFNWGWMAGRMDVVCLFVGLID